MVLHLKLVDVVHIPIRMRLDKLQVKSRSRSGQMRSNFNIDTFATQLPLCDEKKNYGEFNGSLSFRLHGLDLLQMEFEILT